MVSRTTATAEARCRVVPQRCRVRSARHIGPAATEEVDGSRRRAAPGLGDLAAQAVSRRQPVPAARAPAGPSLTAGSPATRSRQPHGYAPTPGTTRMPVNPAARHNRMICTQTTERSMPPTRANTRRSTRMTHRFDVTFCDNRCSWDTRADPFCAATGSMPVKTLTAQILAFCAPTSWWGRGSPVTSRVRRTRADTRQWRMGASRFGDLGWLRACQPVVIAWVFGDD